MFGDTTLCEEEYSLPIRYTGQYNDNETNLYYLNARYYNVNTGRFLTKDTYAGQDNNTLSLNRYTYCYNNPINNYDPTGHFAQALGGLGELASEILPELGPVGAGILAVGVTSYDTMSSYDGDKDMSTFFPGAQSANPKSVDDYISIFPSSAEASESHIIIDYGNPEKSINDFLETFEPHVKSVDDYIISDDFTAGRDVVSIITMADGESQAKTTRVGRWMSQMEYEKMVETGYVQESFSGQTYVANPASSEAFADQIHLKQD